MLTSRLALGTAQFGSAYGVVNELGQVTDVKINEILKYSQLIGIDTIDTAIAYGESEKLLGNAGVGEFKVVSKLPILPEFVDRIDYWVQEQVEMSLARLKINNLYGLLIHDSTQLNSPRGRELGKALNDLRGKGLVAKIGVSIYSPSQLDRVQEVIKVDIVQAPLNIIDRRFVSSGWLNRLSEEGVEIHTRSAFLQGLLLTHSDLIPEKFKPWSVIWSEWDRWLQFNQCTPAEAALGFIQEFSQIDKIVVGVETVNQLKELNEAMNSQWLGKWPQIDSMDEKLIDPYNWSQL
jgi:aryl-alcohol dehydrogenase-like predicted oxidoreductase